MDRRIQLRPRLQAVAEMIHNDAVTADVGCDHGRLCVALLQSGRTLRVLASDISEASLSKARALARHCGKESDIAFFVSDGLSHIPPGGADSIVFAGMGGEQIASMLAARPEVARSAKRLIMQPMRGTYELRSYLFAHAYRILDERVIPDAGRYYQVLCAAAGEPEPLPEGLPEAALMTYGILPLLRGDKEMLNMLLAYREGNFRRLLKAQSRAKTPAPLVKILEELDILIAYIQNIPENRGNAHESR